MQEVATREQFVRDFRLKIQVRKNRVLMFDHSICSRKLPFASTTPKPSSRTTRMHARWPPVITNTFKSSQVCHGRHCWATKMQAAASPKWTSRSRRKTRASLTRKSTSRRCVHSLIGCSTHCSAVHHGQARQRPGGHLGRRAHPRTDGPANQRRAGRARPVRVMSRLDSKLTPTLASLTPSGKRWTRCRVG